MAGSALTLPAPGRALRRDHPRRQPHQAGPAGRLADPGGGRATAGRATPCPQFHPAQHRQGPAGQGPAQPVPQGRPAPLRRGEPGRTSGRHRPTTEPGAPKSPPRLTEGVSRSLLPVTDGATLARSKAADPWRQTQSPVTERRAQPRSPAQRGCHQSTNLCRGDAARSLRLTRLAQPRSACRLWFLCMTWVYQPSTVKVVLSPNAAG